MSRAEAGNKLKREEDEQMIELRGFVAAQPVMA